MAYSGFHFLVKIICIALILLIIILHVYDFFKQKYEEKKTKSLEDIAEDAFVEGVLEGANETDILKEREDAAIIDIFTEEDKDSDNTNNTGKSNKKFYEGDINWKFTDTNNNYNCWEKWDYMSKENKLIKGDIAKTIVRKDGRSWCAVDKPTLESERREFDKPPTVMDRINQYTGNVWGLVGAIGLGLTEELLTKLVQKSSKEALEKAAKKSSEEAAELLMKKAGKELQEEAGEKMFKESSEKLFKEGSEKLSKESLEKLNKEGAERATAQLNKAIKNKYSSKFLKESYEKLSSELKQNMLEKYGKKTLSNIKDDIARKLGSIVKNKSMDINTKLVGNVIRNKALSSLRSTSAVSSAKLLSTAAYKKALSRVSIEVKQALSITIYRQIVKNVTSDISAMVARKMARVILAKSLIKTKLILTAKVFFRAQAKTFLNMVKAISRTPDDMAKLAIKLASLSKTLGKQTIKNGFKVGLRAAGRLATKLKPGPLAIFDILSFALDMADPMNYNAFMSTDDFNKAVEKANKDRRDLILAEISKDEAFKSSGKKIEDLIYPFILDPTSEADGEEMEKEISANIGKLFDMAKLGQIHPSVDKYLKTINADLASGKLTEKLMEDDTIMEPYTELIDIDSIANVYLVDICKRVGGVVYDTNKCTYTKEKCDKLYSWPLDNKKEGEQYAEIMDGKCVSANPEIRSMCETMDAKWDVDNYSCKMDKDWCRLKGGEMDSNNKCSIPLTQAVFENIFGTTVTRIGATMVRETTDAVKGVFDYFYVGCGYDGEITIRGKCMDSGANRIGIWDCNKSTQQKFMYNSIDNSIRLLSDSTKCISIDSSNNVVIETYTGASKQKFIYDESTKQLKHMEDQSKCIELKDNNNSNDNRFIRAACRDSESQKFGLSRDIITDTGMHCSVTASRSADCPAGYTNNGLTCGRGDHTAFTDSGRVADCPSGYTNTGLTCLREATTAFMDSGRPADCPSGYTNTGLTCLREATTAFMDSGRPADCPSGYTNNGLTCGRGAHTAFTDSGRLADCPAGYMNGGLLGCIYDEFKTPSSMWFSKAGVSASTDMKNCEKAWGVGNCEVTGAPGSRLTLRKCSIQAADKGYKFADKWTPNYATINCSPESGYRQLSYSNHGVCNSDEFLNSELGRCYKKCPSGYTHTGVSCYRGPDTLTASSMTCNSGEFLNKDTGRCYKNCPSGYTHTGVSCYRGPDTLTASSMKCKEGEFFNKDVGRCYKNCPAGYTHTGVSCYRGPDTLTASSMTCKEGEFLSESTGRCYKKCKEVYGDEYTHNGVSCYRPVSTKGEDSMTCMPHEYKLVGVCYPKLLPGFTDLGITQSRKKRENSQNVANLKNSVNKISNAVKSAYN